MIAFILVGVRLLCAISFDILAFFLVLESMFIYKTPACINDTKLFLGGWYHTNAILFKINEKKTVTKLANYKKKKKKEKRIYNEIAFKT